MPHPWQATSAILAEFGPPRPRAREAIAHLLIWVLGHAGWPLAQVLGVRLRDGFQAVLRGRRTRAECEPLPDRTLSFLAGPLLKAADL